MGLVVLLLPGLALLQGLSPTARLTVVVAAGVTVFLWLAQREVRWAFTELTTVRRA